MRSNRKCVAPIYSMWPRGGRTWQGTGAKTSEPCGGAPYLIHIASAPRPIHASLTRICAGSIVKSVISGKRICGVCLLVRCSTIERTAGEPYLKESFAP